MTAPRVAIVGAGVVGLACALRLADDGWAVTVHDEAAPTSASRVAAGMLAPASEALLDAAGPYALLRDARDLWTPLAATLDVRLAREGALHLAAPDVLAARAAALAALGGQAQVLEGRALAELWPAGLAPPQGPALFTPEDWRLPAAATLDALRAQAVARGVAIRHVRLAPEAATPAALGADAVVLAAGWGAAGFAALAPEAAALHPIKGQRLGFAAPPFRGPVLRAAGVYLAPDEGGVIAGATMEPGLADLAPDAARADALRHAAVALAPGLARAAPDVGVGVRACTPDGRPLVGPSSTLGVFWAAGMRRNGWLLAPLVAEVLAAYLSRRDPGPHAPLLHPRRFGPAH